MSSQQLIRTLAELEESVDAILVLNLAGIDGENGEKLNTRDCMSLVARKWSKLSIGTSSREIKDGLLCEWIIHIAIKVKRKKPATVVWA